MGSYDIMLGEINQSPGITTVLIQYTKIRRFYSDDEGLIAHKIIMTLKNNNHSFIAIRFQHFIDFTAPFLFDCIIFLSIYYLSVSNNLLEWKYLRNQ